MIEPLKVLLLAGTKEARDLADLLKEDGRLAVTSSLAGVTNDPAPLGLPTRSGGFGGVDGLIDYLRAEKIEALIDATHPFAAQMTRHAAEACAATGTAMLRLQRQQWQPLSDDNWQMVADPAAAAAALKPGARAFLAIGRKELSAFAHRDDVHYLMRMIDPPQAEPEVATPDQIIPTGDIVYGQPSAKVEVEEQLLRDHAITVVVAKNSGGKAGAAKLAAARRLGLPVVMIERPTPPDQQQALELGNEQAPEQVPEQTQEQAESIAAAMHWLEQRLMA